MSTKPPTQPILPDLSMPLRNALRGVATLADATDELLEPAKRLLPVPVRLRFHRTKLSLEAAGKRLIHAPIDKQKIETASLFLTAADTSTTALQSCATVFVYAVEHLNEAFVEQRHMISETIVVQTLKRVTDQSVAKGDAFAAEQVLALCQSSAVSRLPGLKFGTSEQQENEINLFVLSVAGCLLSDRSETVDEEERILDLSLTLIEAMQDEVRVALTDSEGLGRFLSGTSKHL